MGTYIAPDPHLVSCTTVYSSMMGTATVYHPSAPPSISSSTHPTNQPLINQPTHTVNPPTPRGEYGGYSKVPLTRVYRFKRYPPLRQ